MLAVGFLHELAHICVDELGALVSFDLLCFAIALTFDNERKFQDGPHFGDQGKSE